MNTRKLYLWLFVGSGFLFLLGVLAYFLFKWEHIAFISSTVVSIAVSVFTGTFVAYLISIFQQKDLKIEIALSKERIEKMIALNTLKLSFFLFINFNGLESANDDDKYKNLIFSRFGLVNGHCSELKTGKIDIIIDKYNDRIKDLVIYLHNYIDVLPNSHEKGIYNYIVNAAERSIHERSLEDKINTYILILHKLELIKPVKELFDNSFKEVRNIIKYFDL